MSFERKLRFGRIERVYENLPKLGDSNKSPKKQNLERSKSRMARVSIGNYYRPITDGKSVKKPTQTLRKNIGNYESFSNDEIKQWFSNFLTRGTPKETRKFSRYLKEY